MERYVVDASQRGARIAREIYGQFAEHLGRGIYEGIYVGEDSPIPQVNGLRTDVVEALKEIRVPVLRWPGGCFADEYHWRDGIGPKEKRKRMVNVNWGGVVENNHFGTHEYMELCRQLGCETYVNGNLGSGTVQEMSEWVEYMTHPGGSPMADLRRENGREEPWTLDFFGVGNESWGCGGNMTPEFYGNLYRQYQTFLRQYQPEGKRFARIACGPNIDDTEWTEGLLKTLFRHCEEKFHGHTEGISLHHYTHLCDFAHKGSATDFDAGDFYRTLANALRMEDLIGMHSRILDVYDPEKNLGLIVDEWGTWFDAEPGTNPNFLYQQCTMRDALAACLTLNIFNHHADRVRMACIAQMVNVLQAMILTDGAEMVKTPTWHVFNLFKHHQDGTLVSSRLLSDSRTGEEAGLSLPLLSESASVSPEGKLTITLGNLSLSREVPLTVSIQGYPPTEAQAQVLTEEVHAMNTFEDKDRVSAKPLAVEQNGNELVLTLPPCSVVCIRA